MSNAIEVVYFYPTGTTDYELYRPAFVASRIDIDRVNLMVIDSNGKVQPVENVKLVAQGESAPEVESFCCYKAYDFKQLTLDVSESIESGKKKPRKSNK